MMEPIFHNGKNSSVENQKLRDWTKWFAAIHSVFLRKIQCFSHMI
jgi:hypothetical protein